jgi:hypothetical protein
LFAGRDDDSPDTSMNGIPNGELDGTSPGVSGGMVEGTFDGICDCLILRERVMPGTMVGISTS